MSEREGGGSDAVQRALDRTVLRRVRTTAVVGGCDRVRASVRRNERRVQLRLDGELCSTEVEQRWELSAAGQSSVGLA